MISGSCEQVGRGLQQPHQGRSALMPGIHSCNFALLPRNLRRQQEAWLPCINVWYCFMTGKAWEGVGGPLQLLRRSFSGNTVWPAVAMTANSAAFS
jgi:hypothetical protein